MQGKLAAPLGVLNCLPEGPAVTPRTACPSDKPVVLPATGMFQIYRALTELARRSFGFPSTNEWKEAVEQSGGCELLPPLILGALESSYKAQEVPFQASGGPSRV